MFLFGFNSLQSNRPEEQFLWAGFLLFYSQKKKARKCVLQFRAAHSGFRAWHPAEYRSGCLVAQAELLKM